MKIQHASYEYNESLEQIKKSVLSMANFAKRQFNDATNLLLENDQKVANLVAKLDYKINRMEMSIDEKCANIIARRSPMATDLRFILMVIKMVTDLERIGDEAEKIAKFSSELADTNISQLKFNKSLKHMIRVAQEMLNGAIYSYKKLDVNKAQQVSKLDLELDDEFENLNRLLITYMLEDSKNIENALKVIYCARSIERAGDHAKNICEYIIYVVYGKDVRHTTKKDQDNDFK